jgi:hypothetical protein
VRFSRRDAEVQRLSGRIADEHELLVIRMRAKGVDYGFVNCHGYQFMRAILRVGFID